MSGAAHSAAPVPDRPKVARTHFPKLPSEKKFPLSEPDPAGHHLLTRSEVLARYDRLGTPATLQEMTYRQATRRFGGLTGHAPANVIYPARMFWVITYHYNPPIRALRAGGFGPPQPRGHHLSEYVRISAESAVIDALTGTETDSCGGCDSLPVVDH
jgi:hypothetical protein